jgi:hypothetical protein
MPCAAALRQFRYTNVRIPPIERQVMGGPSGGSGSVVTVRPGMCYGGSRIRRSQWPSRIRNPQASPSSLQEPSGIPRIGGDLCHRCSARSTTSSAASRYNRCASVNAWPRERRKTASHSLATEPLAWPRPRGSAVSYRPRRKGSFGAWRKRFSPPRFWTPAEVVQCATMMASLFMLEMRSRSM